MLLIKSVQDMGIPIASSVKAVQYITADHYVAREQSTYDSWIADLVGRPIETKSFKHAQLMFGYLVTTAIEHPAIATEAAIKIASDKVEAFLTMHPWLANVGIATEVEDENGNVTVISRKPRTGTSKRDQSIALYNTVKDKNMTRKDLIELFVNKLELTPGGASTYVHNCRSGLWK